MVGCPSNSLAYQEGFSSYLPVWHWFRFVEDVSEVLVCYALGVYETQRFCQVVDPPSQPVT